MQGNSVYKNECDYDNERIELIDGKIFMMSPRARIDHARVCANVLIEFGSYLKNKSCEVFGDGVDVYLDDKNHFIPDAMIVCNKDIITDFNIQGAPDLVVEVLSPATAKNDRGKKMKAYEKFGVREYWIIDPFGKTVEVYLNSDNGFEVDYVYYYLTNEEIAQNAALQDNDKRKINIRTAIKVSVCDNLIVNLADIFKNL